ncbi:MAG: CsgG/HfaB family protein [Candidatus Aminicenantaceae bacterium]
MKIARILTCFILLFLSINNDSLTQARIKTAILYFNDTSMDKSYSSFVISLPDMLMTDLRQSGEIYVVDKFQIDEAYRNFNIEKLSYIDESTAIKMGKWLGVNAVVMGNFSSFGKDVRIDTKIINTEHGTLIKAFKVKGQANIIYDLVDFMSEEILSILTEEPKDFLPPQKILLDKEFELRFPSLTETDPVENGSYKNLYRYTDPNSPSISFRIFYRFANSDKWLPRPLDPPLYEIHDVHFYFEDLASGRKTKLFYIDRNEKVHHVNDLISTYKIRADVIYIDVQKKYSNYNIPAKSLRRAKIKITVEWIYLP